MQQLVDFVVAEPVTTSVQIRDQFQVRYDRPAIWLQKIAAWVLEKLGAYGHRDFQTMKRYRIDTRKVVDLIAQQGSYLDLFFHQRAKRLLIGAEDFANLMGEKDVTQSIYSFPVSFQSWSHGFGTRVLGLQVTVVPWMRGVLVMPEDTETKMLDEIDRLRIVNRDLTDQVRQLSNVTADWVSRDEAEDLEDFIGSEYDCGEHLG